jgi:dTMP kinase
VEIGMQRAAVRRGNGAADRFESEGASFHEGLRRAYRTIAAGDPARCVLIDATPDQDSVGQAIWSEVRERLLGQTAASPA